MNYLIGHQIEHYRVEAVLGDGGMGTVYRAYDLQHDRLVAVKVMSANLAQKPQFQRRFAQEAQATNNFNSPHIVKVYHFGTYQEMPYMVMEYVAGGSLTDYLKQLQWAGRRMPLDEMIALAAQVAEGLSYAHQRGVVHRDIKPDNILLRLKEDTAVGPKQAVITDFGLAVLLKEGQEVSTNPVMGSLPYMSPEQCANLPLDGRSDIYSLGVMLYQLTTGQMPFRIEAPVDIVKHLQDTPLPPRLINPQLPQVVEDVVLKALAKKPGDRFQTGAELAHKLRTLDLQATEMETAVSAANVVTQWIEERWVAGVDVRNRIDVNRTWTSEGDYRLFITHQWEESRVESLSGARITIGRHPDNDIVLDDHSVSAHHARLERTPQGWQVVDLGSTNGTSLENQELEYEEPQEWASYQTLRIGPFALQWQAFTGRPSSRPGAHSAGGAPPPLIVRTGANGRGQARISPVEARGPLAAAPGSVMTLEAISAATRQPIDWDDPDLIAAQVGETLELTLTPATVEVMPGQEVQVQVMVMNLGTTVEDISLRVLELGQSPTWIILHNGLMKLLPGESQTVLMQVTPPQDSTVLAGAHTIEVQASTSRGGIESVTGQVLIAPWEEFSLDLHPRNLQEKINCRLTITDLGNFTNVYEIEGLDDSEALNFHFDPPQNGTLVADAPNQQHIRLQPGSTSLQTFTIQPKKRPWFRAPTRPFPFKIRVRTQTTDWQTLDGQVSVSPRLSLRFLLLVLFLLLLMVLLGFWAVNRVQTEARNNASATATAVRATLSVFEGAANDAQATADALRAAGDEAGAAAAQATADALRATLVAQNEQLDEVSAQLQITPTPVPAPVDITLDSLSVPENADIGTTVGTFSVSLAEGPASLRDPAGPAVTQADEKLRYLARSALQAGPRITLSLVSGSGDADNASFFIEGTALKTAERFDFETQSSYSLRVRADNGAGSVFEKSFTIVVADLNDTPALSIADVTVDEDVGTAVLAINMTNNSNSTVSVDVTTADGTARQGDDYTTFEGIVSWQPGETGRKTVEISILDDDVYELDETFTVRLANPVIGLINNGTATVSIVDDDDLPELSIADLTIGEDDGQATLIVTMSGLSSQEVSVSYATADGTARANADYTAASGTLTWRAGETGPKSVAVAILDDEVYENNETFVVNLSSAVNAALADGSATVTIEEDDPLPVVTIVQTLVVDEPEEADGNVFLTATMDRASSVNVTVNYATSDDTAVKGRDYLETTGTLTWQPGETGIKSLPVVVKADRIFEPNEVFLVTLSNPTNATLNNATARVTISNSDDLPTVQVLDNVTVTEGQGVRARIQVRLNGGSSTPVSVSYVTENDTATADQDYRPAASNATLSWNAEEADTVKEILIDLIDDRIDELDGGETFFVILNGVSSNNAALSTQNRAVVTILDNDQPPQLQLRTERVEEGGGQQQIQVRLFGGSYQDVEVSVGVSNDTAVSGQDFTFTAVPPLVFPANEVDRILSFPIQIIDDPIFEPGDDETFNVALTPDPDTGVTALNGSVGIVDNDTAPVLRIMNSSLSVAEGTGSTATTLTITVRLEGGINRAVTAVVNTEDITALANADYIPISGLNLSFPASAINTQRSFAVQIIADGIDEADEERFRVRITTPQDPDVGDTNGVVIIQDDDVAGMSVTPTTLNVAEDNPVGATYSVRLTSVPTDTVTITIDPDDQLQVAGPSQPIAPPGQPVLLIIPANSSATTPRTITVVPVDDSLVEGPHTAQIDHTSSSADPQYQGRAQVVTVAIEDDDLPPVILSGQNRDISEIASANTPIGSVISATVRSTSGTLQDWTIVSVTPVTATTYFAIDGSGQVRLTAVGAGNLDREGPVISYTLALTVSDGFSVSDPPENVVVNVLDANDEPPVIPAQSRDVPEDNGPIPFDTPLTAVDPDITPTTFQNWTIVSVNPPGAVGYFAIDPDSGQLSLTASGASAIDFETPPNLYTLNVTVSDGVQTSAPQAIAVNVTDANDPPMAADDGYNATEDVTLTVAAPGVLANDTDVDAAGDTLTVIAVNGNSSVVGAPIILDSGASLTLNANGSFSYNTNNAYDYLAAGELGSDAFLYTVGDGNGGSDVGEVTLVIVGTDDPPTAVDDTGATTQDDVLTVSAPGVLGNDTDVDTPAASLTVTAVNGSAAAVGNQITLPSGALLTLNANGSYIYDPNGQFDDLAASETAEDNFTYTVSGAGGGSDIGTVTITITGLNDPPVAVDDTGSTNEDTPLTVSAPGVLGNDTDPDGTAGLLVTAVNGSAAAVGNQITLPSGALLTLNANGSYTYNPNDAFETLAVGQNDTDSFTYTVSDDVDSDVGTVTITITGVNDPPVAVDDTGSTAEDTPVTVAAPSLLGNDTDVDVPADSLAVTAVNGSTASVGNQITLPSGALLTLTASGGYTYDPNDAFESLGVGETDTDSFTYTVSDGNGGSDTGAVTITINGVNDAPALGNITASTTYTEGQNLVLLAPAGTVTDPDQPASFGGGVFTVQIIANGTISDELGIDVASMPGNYTENTGQNQIRRGPPPTTLIATYNDNPGAWPTALIITFTANATLTDVQAVLRGMYFNNVVNSLGGPPNPATLSRTVRFTLTDGQGGISNQPTMTINVVAAQSLDGMIVAQGFNTLELAAQRWLDDPAPQLVHTWQPVKGQILPT